MDPNRTEKRSTTGSAIGILLIVLALIACAAVLVIYPNVLENILVAGLIIIAAVAVIAIGVALFAGLLAVPMYAKKGEVYQTDMSYSVDDVEEVKGTVEEDHKAH